MALSMLHLIAFVLIPTFISASNICADEDCDRIRRPIHLLSNQELSLYAEGLKAIRRNGKYQYMIEAHHEHTSAHRGPAFFFYHSYFVWEVETLSTYSFYPCSSSISTPKQTKDKFEHWAGSSNAFLCHIMISQSMPVQNMRILF